MTVWTDGSGLGKRVLSGVRAVEIDEGTLRIVPQASDDTVHLFSLTNGGVRRVEIAPV